MYKWLTQNFSLVFLLDDGSIPVANPIYNISYVGLGEDGSLIWVEGDAESLTFEDNSVDAYTIAFGIRNVTHIEKALAEAYR